MTYYKIHLYAVEVPTPVNMSEMDNWDWYDLAEANKDRADIIDTATCSKKELDNYININTLEVEGYSSDYMTIYWYDDPEEIPLTEEERDYEAKCEADDRWYDDYRERRDGLW